MSWLVPALLLTAVPAPSAPPPMTPEVRSLVERMQAFYEKTTDFTADWALAARLLR